jgi:hypothetical protein
MYPKLKINVYFIFLNIGDLTFGITLVDTVYECPLESIPPYRVPEIYLESILGTVSLLLLLLPLTKQYHGSMKK